MKAIVQYAYGSADVLELRDVLVRVHAAGVNPGVWHLMTGVPYLMRILGATRICYNSCRNRHCPKCQFLDKERWVDA
jgi:hypothetical protein